MKTKKPKLGRVYDYPGDPKTDDQAHYSPSKIEPGRYVFNGFSGGFGLLEEEKFYRPDTTPGSGSYLHSDFFPLLEEVEQ